MFPLFLNVLLTFLLFIKFGTISFQLFVHLSAPSVYIYTLQMVITYDLAQERKNLQFGIPNTFLLLLNSGKFKSLRSYKMSCFGKWIGMPTEFRNNSKSVFFLYIPPEWKTFGFRKTSESGFGETPQKNFEMDKFRN